MPRRAGACYNGLMRFRKGPWTVLESRVVYKNPWMEVREDKVITPGGKDGRYGSMKLKSGVSIIALDAKKNVYLTKEYHYGIGKTTLEAVSGGQEKGHSPLQTAKRELLEEAGLKARKWTPLGRADALTTYLAAPMRLYLAEDLAQHEQELEEVEVIEVVKMPLKKALKLIDDGTITHAATIIALLKVAILKKLI